MNRIFEIEKIHTMSDLAAVYDEYVYNGLIDQTVDVDMSKAVIEK